MYRRNLLKSRLFNCVCSLNTGLMISPTVLINRNQIFKNNFSQSQQKLLKVSS